MKFFLGRNEEKRSGSLIPSRDGLWALMTGGGGATAAGVSVTQSNALGLSALYACVRVLSESVAKLPLLTYERVERGKRRAEDHPLYWLLKSEPNPEMTSFYLRETLMGHLATWGNAYAEVDWDSWGMPRALWPLRPDAVDVQRVGGELVYDVYVSGEFQRLPGYRVLHLRGFGFNGLVGYSPVRMHAETLGYSFATREYGARFFGNGARPGVILKHPGVLTDSAYERLKSSWTSAHEGLSNSHRTRILEEGMDVETIGVPPEEAQFLETQKFQVADVARIFLVPPHKIGDLSNATFSNIEEQERSFVVDTLSAWLQRWEQSLARSLLVGEEKRRYFFEFKLEALLAGNMKARSAAYATAIQNGYMSRNEVRALENLNPVEGGDELLVPLNMVPASQLFQNGNNGGDGQGNGSQNEKNSLRLLGVGGRRVARVPEARALTEDDEKLLAERQGMARRNIGLFEDAARRLVKREVADLRRALDKQLREKSRAEFMAWLDEFYADLRERIPDYFEAVVRAVAEQAAAAAAVELDEETPAVDDEFVAGYLETLAGGHVASSNKQLRALMDEANDEAEAADLIEERLDGWEETRSGKIANGQAFESLNALTIASYTTLGVIWLRWLAVGESCEFCQSLSGQVAGIAGFFVMGGDSITGASGATMLVRRNTRHGPIHGGCDCIVVAA